MRSSRQFGNSRCSQETQYLLGRCAKPVFGWYRSDTKGGSTAPLTRRSSDRWFPRPAEPNKPRSGAFNIRDVHLSHHPTVLCVSITLAWQAWMNPTVLYSRPADLRNWKVSSRDTPLCSTCSKNTLCMDLRWCYRRMWFFAASLHLCLRWDIGVSTSPTLVLKSTPEIPATHFTFEYRNTPSPVIWCLCTKHTEECSLLMTLQDTLRTILSCMLSRLSRSRPLSCLELCSVPQCVRSWMRAPWSAASTISTASTIWQFYSSSTDSYTFFYTHVYTLYNTLFCVDR